MGKKLQEVQTFWSLRDKENNKNRYNPYGGSKPTFKDTNRKSSSTQRQLCKKISKKLYAEKVIGNSKILVNEGTPAIFFQNLHRHTPWQAEHFGWRNPAVHGCLRGQNPLEKLVLDFYSLKKKNQIGSKDSPTKPKDRCAKKYMGKKFYANQGFWVNEGIPGNSFKICTDILLDKPSILAEETLLCTDV